MSRRRPQLAFESISLEGGLLSADFLAQVASLEAGQQTADAYQLPRGLQIRDEIGRAWRIAEAHWRDVEAAGPQTEGRQRAVMAMLTEAFGWGSLVRMTSPMIVEDRGFLLTAVGVGGRVPLVVAPGQQDLDAGDVRFGDGTKRRSAFGLVQEYLNAQQSALWGVATNGQVLRLVRDNASLTRPAWIEVDLARIFGEQRYADFSLLWLLLHESRFGTADAPPHEAILEQWRGKSLESGTAARDRLRDGVEEALRALGNGFLAHPGNAVLREALTSGALDAAGYEQQLLRLVYRLIFLLVAEERELLHPPGSAEAALATYRDGYSLRRLRERAVRRRSHDRHDDAWDGLQQTFRGCAAGEPRLALPGLGGLFEASQCPDLEGVRLPNHALLQAVFRLTWLTEGNALVRVNWRDMGTEELGSVYESLLELVPEVHDGAQRFGFVGDPDPNAPLAVAAAGQGTARRLTGSYYTPDSLVQALLDSALDPLIDRALAADDPEHALLSLSILDPAMGSGHFLLGAARRIAGHLAKLRSDGTPGPQAFRSALREVISRCCYGVDKNPMAVELARIALWLEAMEPGKPLAFLAHHLVHGDGILGIHDPAVLAEGIPDEAFTPLTGDDRAAATALKTRNRGERRDLERERGAGQFALTFDQSAWTATLTALEAMPDGTLSEVAAKEAALAGARAAQDTDFRFACDAYVAAFILRKDDRTRQHFPTTGTLRNLGVGVAVPEAMRTMVAEVAASVPFLHWPITFAPIMARGGFDCVVGNPPWEKVTLNDTEFFSVRAPAIAQAATGAIRDRMIQALQHEPIDSPGWRLFQAYQAASHLSEATSSYARGGRRFPLTGNGIVNLYALFAEVALQLVHRDGRAGLVLPSGIASDAGTAPFFRHVADGRLASLIDFENREALFQGVHRSFKFCLLTIGRLAEPTFAFFLSQAEQRFDERRRFTLTAEDLKRLNPNTGTAPIFRSKADAELTAKIYRNVPVLWDETREDGNASGDPVPAGVVQHD
ncbi:MAG: N-6 DNA methylase [Gemmatimonadales bacterium]